MKKFFLPFVAIVLLSAPALASAKLVSDIVETPGHTVQKQGRRAVREAGRRPLWRNPAQLRAETPQLGSIYHNAEFMLSIRYPSDWEKQDIDERESSLTLPVMFLSPMSATPTLRQNVNLVVEELESPLTLAEYTELGIKNEKMFFADFSLVSSTTVPVGGSYRGQRVVFTASTDAGVSMKFAQVWLVRGKHAYVWTFADDEKTFAKNIPTFERMLESFILR